MSDPQEKLAIVLTPAGAVMGSLLDTGDEYLLKKPRTLNVMPQGNNMVKFGFSELIGRPDQMVLTGEISYWCPSDQNVVKAYLEAVSSIKIASTLPRNN